MPAVELHFPTSPERAFAILSEPHRYGSWVVGARQIQAADDSWPAEGATFRHEQGLPLVNLEDTTTVLESRPPTHLALEARVRPLMVMQVILDLTPEAGGTRVRMEELPVGGLLAPVLRLPALHPLIRARNLESLRRLRDIALAPGD